MRLLLPGSSGVPALTELDTEGLYAVYAPARNRWLRSNMVTTLDGSVTGADGRSGSINDEADHVVFELLRAQADAVVVGAGTLRTERYTPIGVHSRWQALREAHGREARLPLVAVGNSGQVPPRLRGVRDGSVLLATCAAAPGLADARATLGEANVVVAGDSEVDLRVLVEALRGRGFGSLLTEGGPSLLGSLLASGVVDELCHTVVPRVVGGGHHRSVEGPDVDVALHLETLVEQDGTLLGRWLTRS